MMKPIIAEGQFGLYQPKGDRFHLLMGKAAVVNADGSVAWEEADWQPNALADEGEQSMLNVYLLAASNPSKYLGLLNMASPGETTIMSGVTETATGVGNNGYARQLISSGDWATPVLNSGDYQSTAAQKTFGAATGSSWTATHAFMTTTAADLLGKFILYIALSASTTVAVGQSFLYTLSWKMQ